MNRKKLRKHIGNNGSTICLVLSLLFFLVSLLVGTPSRNSENVAAKVGQRTESRMRVLDKYIQEAISFDHEEWLREDLPEDMVVYRYIYDTLQSWCHQFPVMNDDLSSKVVFQHLSNQRSNLTSPLLGATVEVSYMSLGPKWYLVKVVPGGMACKIIAGIVVQGPYSGKRSLAAGTNEHFKIPRGYRISALADESGGTAVYFNDVPIFKLVTETTAGSDVANSTLRWSALLLVMLALVLFLRQHRRLRYFYGVLVLFVGAAAVGYVWGLQSRETIMFFSPSVYAGGPFLYSFGTLAMLNILLILMVICTFIMRKVIYRKVLSQRWKTALYGGLLGIFTLVLAAYSVATLRSLIMNSNIPWELYLWTQLSGYTVISYVMYFLLMLCILLLVQIMVPVVHVFAGRKYMLFSRGALLIFAGVCAIYFTAISSVLGFKKEQNRMAVYSNRLAVDRDLALELNLRGVEEGIASDPVISALSHIDQSDYLVYNRLTETYMTRISQNYDVTVVVCANNNAGCFAQYENRLLSGVPIAERSRFTYTYDANGRAGYLAMFVYYSSEKGIARVLVDVSDRSNREDRGVYSLLGNNSRPGNVTIPSGYSYAKYMSGRLTRYKGDYAYPTVMYGELEEKIAAGNSYIRNGKYIHFVNEIYDDEYIVVSRPCHSLLVYIVTFSYLLIINLLLVFPILHSRRRKRKNMFRNNYFRSRINAVLFISLFLTLVVMATLSATFVYRRNVTNMYSVMSEKITTIQSMLETQCRSVTRLSDVDTRDLAAVLDGIATDIKADITVFTTGGKVFSSTTPEVFERMELGSRINEDAYYNIMFQHQRFFINDENIGGEKFYTLYAPVINAGGETIAIACVPYAEQNIDFRHEAFFHAATFINVFLVLIAITLLVSTVIVNNLFKPLEEMGKKMNSADLHEMEYIIYKRKDEVSSLVEAYNRMVHDLYESMKQVTQAERDKAWSEMARQVAHEIKNPLTPIKLELQRLIRLKEHNDPSWGEKFDKVSAIALEHIDILTDTANEFSTFAKLYTEEPVLIDLDKTLRDQVMIFDNKENIEMSYMGLEGVRVMAPRPQLIRVFVNLLTNAVQAVEMAQNDDREAGRGVCKGRIFIGLRNGVKDGFYDIVFEDNGSGVKDENQAKLFSPNFTTKSSGTGLGLAICRNIVEKCNGRIYYQRSFNLGGACFVVSLPKMCAGKESET